MDTIDIVNSVVAGDKEAFMNAFNAAIANKVSDALEVKKVEIASSLITSPEEQQVEFANEISGTENDVAGEIPATESE